MVDMDNFEIIFYIPKYRISKKDVINLFIKLILLRYLNKSIE